MNPTRRMMLSGGLLLTVVTMAGRQARAATKPSITVHKGATCDCCKAWVEHLRKHGYSVKAEDVADLGSIKQNLGVPAALQSCHTAQVDGYVIEGHVPADLIDRLLRDRPPVVGLAVPGMPIGSPGMEVPGHAPDRYQILTFDRSGRTTVYASR